MDGADGRDLSTAVLIAIGLSFLIASIEIPTRSKASLRACMVSQSLIYCVILSVGNVVTTILASLVIAQQLPGLSAYFFLLFPFFGVFGFETILKNTNITMFDRGVLTIQAWIEKALNAAAGAAIDRQEDLKEVSERKIYDALMRLTEQDLNTRILHKLGPDVVAQLDQAAQASSANSKQYKALQLAAKLTPNEAKALLAGR